MSALAQEAQASLIDVLQRMVDLLDRNEAALQGIPNFHIFFALVWACLDELVVALHLARHQYLLQANSHLRAVVEAADKIALFRKDHSQTLFWSSEDWQVRLRELSPRRVREKLGRDRFDELYGYLSEAGTHLSFRAFQDRVYWQLKDGTAPKLVVRTGGTPVARLEQMFYPSCCQTITRLLVQVEELNLDGSWLVAVDELMAELWSADADWTERHFIPWAVEEGLDVSGLWEKVAASRAAAKDLRT